MMNFRSPFDPEDIPAEWLIERCRIERNRLLAASDWTQLPDAPCDTNAWAAYRQQLRDFMATYDGTTDEVTFPTPPT